MRAALWLLALFGAAVAVALFAGSNQGTITVFWPPYRVDLSLNMALVLLGASFALLYAALRGLAALLELPERARRWRLLQKERAMHGALLDAMAQLLAGRFLRARRAAESAVQQERTLAEAGEALPHGRQLRTLAHLLAGEAAHALQDASLREEHLQQALQGLPERASGPEAELRDGAQLRAARWALDERDADGALERLAGLSVGASRRTLALRARLKAARLTHRTAEALDTARLLAKHRAFSPAAAASIVRSLVLAQIDDARDTAQLQRTWAQLEAVERLQPDIAAHAARRLGELGGESAQVRAWLLPAWERALADGPPRAGAQGDTLLKLVGVLQNHLQGLDATWLARIEAASRAHPHDARLLYLSAMACMHRELWGKARQLLQRAAPQLKEPQLRANAWRALAALAEQQGDEPAAAQAWKQAALVEDD
ncbi:heme biosynthesis protein HemY [Melaminivora suipulveris]|uniref:Heme biosynthesis protein HemY n=1 Tax=Melaminivora suipulveris TaxID=2109913 RepID=A0A2R3QEN5_9BURK|nr:heme biosynthesis HemY N-terminal domain-containing protein [Melaminivora suipulveris]AVO50256.1 heme biosynthesis protein HemY [Melaminivora suipulveris]